MKPTDQKGSETITFSVVYLGQCGCGFRRKVERKIELKQSQTLDDLQEAIIWQSFGWDDPHLYSFFFDNKPYSQNRKMEYSIDPEPDETFGGEKSKSSKIKLSELKLKKGQKFLLVFDFGDDHHFGIKVDGFGIAEKGKKYPLILEETGKAPKQYP